MTMPDSPPLPLRTQQKNYTRQRLLEVAGTLFAAQGLAATGMDDIARTAGTSRATVYTHFAGKPAIVRALLAEIWDNTLTQSAAFDALPEVAPDTVKSWLAQVFAAWDSYAACTKVLLSETATACDGEVHARFAANAAALMHSRHKWLHFTPEEAHRRAYLLLLQLHRCLSSCYTGGWSTDRDALLATLTEIWCATLQPRGT